MIQFKIKLDRGNKHTKVDECKCLTCDKVKRSSENMWEVAAYSRSRKDVDEVQTYLGLPYNVDPIFIVSQEYFCSKRCAETYILQEMQ